MTLREQFRKDVLGTQILKHYLGLRPEKVTLSQLESMDLRDSARGWLSIISFVALVATASLWAIVMHYLDSYPPYQGVWVSMVLISFVVFMALAFVEPPAVYTELMKDIAFLRASKWMKDLASLRASDRLDSDSVLQGAERELFGLALRLKFLECNVRQSGVSTEEMYECLVEWKLKRTHFDEIYAFASKFVELRQKSYYFGVKES